VAGAQVIGSKRVHAVLNWRGAVEGGWDSRYERASHVYGSPASRLHASCRELFKQLKLYDNVERYGLVEEVGERAAVAAAACAGT
jgi:hypothetical protein